MARSSDIRKRKPSGGTIKVARKKQHAHLASRPTMTKISERSTTVSRSLGSAVKQRILTENKVNVFDPKKKKAVIATIKVVVENPANRNFIRRNILTKGTVVDTDLGKVRITSRPGQVGSLSGVLV